MKQQYMVCLACALLTAGHVRGQVLSTHQSKPNKAFVYAYGNSSFCSNVPLNEISPRAFRYLLKKYPAAQGERWYSSPLGLYAAFSDSVYATRLHFNPKGRFVSSDRAYTEKGLSPTLKEKLGALFPGYKVQTVVEGFDGSELSYTVIISKATVMKSVELRGSGVVTVDEFRYDATAPHFIQGPAGPATASAGDHD